MVFIRDLFNFFIFVYVFCKIGNSVYIINVIIVGSFLIFINGINSLSNVSDGIVCIIVEVFIINLVICFFFVNKMLSGIVIIIVKNNEISDICKCLFNVVSNFIFCFWNVCIKLVIV